VTGKPHLVETEKGNVLVIPARINANLKSKTIEEIQAQRRDLHLRCVCEKEKVRDSGWGCDLDTGYLVGIRRRVRARLVRARRLVFIF